jgi:hypothetical protein
MKNFQKKTLLKMANVNMGIVNFPKLSLIFMVQKSSTTKEANELFHYILFVKEYKRIFDNWNTYDYEQAKINATNLMLDLRKRV